MADKSKYMARRFLKMAAYFRGVASHYRAKSPMYAKLSQNNQIRYALFQRSAATYLSKYKLMRMKYNSMRLMMKQVMRQAISFRS